MDDISRRSAKDTDSFKGIGVIDMEPAIGNAKQSLTLDDLTVGQTFQSRSHSLDADQIKSFAGQFDPQPFHLSEELATNSLFGGLAASGWHTAALTMRMLVESLPILGGLIGAGGEISWPQPTRPGDTLNVETEVLEIRRSRSRPDRGIVTVRSTTRNQADETVQVLVSKLVVPSRSQLGE
jgi:acyl dehydratase